MQPTPHAIRRLLVSPGGVVHHPNCSRVPVNAEVQKWGQNLNVVDALREVRAGRMTNSHFLGTTRGPGGTRVCHCLDDVAA